VSSEEEIVDLTVHDILENVIEHFSEEQKTAVRANNQIKNRSPRHDIARRMPDCDRHGNGKCSECHGSGNETDVFEALAESLSGTSQNCKKCHGSGDCTTCDGKGTIAKTIFDD
jgi:hypothetical protein